MCNSKISRRNTSIDETSFQTSIDELQSQLDAIAVGVKEALATCRHTLEQAIDRVPVEEPDHDEAESE
jgi:hypothetical protein